MPYSSLMVPGKNTLLVNKDYLKVGGMQVLRTGFLADLIGFTKNVATQHSRNPKSPTDPNSHCPNSLTSIKIGAGEFNKPRYVDGSGS